MPGSVRSESPTKTRGSRFNVFQHWVWHSPTRCHSGACTVQFVSICRTAVSITKENAGTTESLWKTLSPHPKMALRLVIYLAHNNKKHLNNLRHSRLLYLLHYSLNWRQKIFSWTEHYHTLKSAPTYHSSLKVWMDFHSAPRQCADYYFVFLWD